MRKLFFFLGLLIGYFSLFTTSAFAFSGSGAGTSGDPYQITTCSQLHEIDDDLNADYLIENDIDCTGFSFAPIGDANSNFFEGTLDGGGHEITNLTINSNTDGVGIFQGLGGEITRLGYESGSVTGGATTDYAGSLVGRVVGGNITSSYSKVDVITTASFGVQAGGLVGNGSSITISDCYYVGTVTRPTAVGNPLGGLVGIVSLASSITNSYMVGTLVNGNQTGGIVGNMTNGDVTGVFSSFTSTNSSNIGGIFGALGGGSVSDAYWNQISGSPAHCYGSSDTGCTMIDNSASYFYTVTNSPMDSWDFDTKWSNTNNGSSYPILLWEVPVPTSTPTPTPEPTRSGGSSSSSNSSSSQSTPSCSTTPNGFPNLFQVNTTKNAATLYFSPAGNAQNYLISYGFNSDANQFNVFTNQGSSTGVLAYTVNELPTNSNTYFKVYAQNNCGQGNWGNTMQVVTNGRVYYKNLVSQVLGILPKKTTVLGAKTSRVLGAKIKCEAYTVQSGDSLWSIASEKLGNGASYTTIMKSNNLNSSNLNPGQEIKVGC